MAWRSRFPCFAGLIVRCISWRLSWGWLQDVCASRFQLHSGAAYPCISRPPVFPTPKNYFCQLNTPLPTLFIANCCTFLYHIMSKIQYTIYIYNIYIWSSPPATHPPMVSPLPTYIQRHIYAYLPTYIPATFLPTYMPAYLHTYMSTYRHTYGTYIHPFLPTYLLTYLPSYIHAHMHSYIRRYLPRYIHQYLPTCMHSFVHTCLPT